MTLSYIKSWLLSLFHNTALPQIIARALISFQQIFTPATKQDRRLLLENSSALYNLWCQG